MISKELLSEVLVVEPIHIEDEPIIEKEYIVFKKTLNSATAHSSINIYELAHKCKEWAKAQGYQIWSGHQCRGDIFACSVYVKDDYANDDDFVADTEPEAIFKACEWILNDRR